MIIFILLIVRMTLANLISVRLTSTLGNSSLPYSRQDRLTASQRIGNYPFDCYKTPSRFGPVFYRHCEQVAAQILQIDPQDRPKLFSEDATLADIGLPASFTHQTCFVTVRAVEYDDDMDTFRPSELALYVSVHTSMALAWKLQSSQIYSLYTLVKSCLSFNQSTEGAMLTQNYQVSNTARTQMRQTSSLPWGSWSHCE